MIAATSTRLACAVAAVVLAGACKKVIDADKAEETITDAMAQKGIAATVVCPEGRTPKAGDVFQCQAVDDVGTKLTITVTQKDSLGNIEWKLEGGVVDTDVIIKEAQAKIGADAVIKCPRKVIVLREGEVATCTVTRGAETARMSITADGSDVAWQVE